MNLPSDATLPDGLFDVINAELDRQGVDTDGIDVAMFIGVVAGHFWLAQPVAVALTRMQWGVLDDYLGEGCSADDPALQAIRDEIEEQMQKRPAG